MPPQERSLTDLAALVADVATSLEARRATRYLLGIAGPPGAGKSTVSAQVVEMASIPACIAPMDGFHRSNDHLRTTGLLRLKGVPATFDASGFVARLAEARHATERSVVWPTYDRDRQEVVAEGHVIEPDHRLVVVEGNYLLFDEPPWDGVRPLLDTVWYLDVPPSVLALRLTTRHERDRPPAAAAEKVASTDLPNAELVASTRFSADVILRQV